MSINFTPNIVVNNSVACFLTKTKRWMGWKRGGIVELAMGRHSIDTHTLCILFYVLFVKVCRLSMERETDSRRIDSLAKIYSSVNGYENCSSEMFGFCLGAGKPEPIIKKTFEH